MVLESPLLSPQIGNTIICMNFLQFLIFKKVGRCEIVRLLLCKRIKMSPRVMSCSLKNASLHICIVYSYTKDPAMFYFLVTLNGISISLRTPRKSFFSKIPNFWAWADILGWNVLRHLGYFRPNYQHYFGTLSPMSMGKWIWLFFL